MRNNLKEEQNSQHKLFDLRFRDDNTGRESTEELDHQSLNVAKEFQAARKA